jgi:cysteine desulfurase
MTTHHIYLDNSATTAPLPDVIEAMTEAMSASYGNPSSSHARGDAARRVLERARSAVADLMGVDDAYITFTSGATEANNLAVLSCLPRDRTRSRFVTTTVEHSSVLKLCERLEDEGANVVRIPVSSSGVVDLEELERALEEPTDLVSVQWDNNETGVIQPIEAVAALTSRKAIRLHVDAAQAFGKLVLRVADLPIDYVSVTAHKIHGPQGAGALYVRPGQSVLPLLHGGPQESGRRAGTENVPGIVGFGRAAEIRKERHQDVSSLVKEFRDNFEARIRQGLPDTEINGGSVSRVSGSTNILFPGIDGQALVARLDQAGVYCSQSSACTNMRPEPSYVLRAMGLSEVEAYSSVRFSFSELNTHAEIEVASDIVIEAVRRLRSFEGAGTFAAA